MVAGHRDKVSLWLWQPDHNRLIWAQRFTWEIAVEVIKVEVNDNAKAWSKVNHVLFGHTGWLKKARP